LSGSVAKAIARNRQAPVQTSKAVSGHSKPPRLFDGTSFDQTPAPNRFGLAPFYSQHVWIWKNNPAGVLAMWNPQVHCPM